MAIIDTELLIYRAAVNNDTASNGGRMSSTQATSGSIGNGFPNVDQTERTTGSTKYRKLFWKIANDNDLAYQNPKFWINIVTPGDDIIGITGGNPTNIQSDLTGSEDYYGGGVLNSNIIIGATSCVVLVESWALMEVFRIGDKVRISDMETLGVLDVNGTGNEEFVILDSVTPAGNLITLAWTGGLVNGYVTTGAGTGVSSVVEPSDVIGSFDSFVVTSAAGLYDEITNPIAVDSIGGVYDTWTLTFTSPSVFSCVGTIEGNLGSGSIGASFAPINTNFSKPYFTMDSAGWSGSLLAGDLVTFTTYPASWSFWAKRIVPIGASPTSPDNWTVATIGDTSA